MDKKVIILNYHQIVNGETAGADLFSITEKEFRKQLSFIDNSNINVCSLQDVSDNSLRDEVNVVFTFDDGNESDIKIAFPILLEYGFTASFFINSGADTINWKAYEKCLAVDFSVESHGSIHQNFKKLNQIQKIESLRNSKNTIEKHLNNTVRYFAFPYGSYTLSDVELALQNGYQATCSTKIHANRDVDKKVLHRWSIKSTTTFETFTKVLTEERFFNRMVKQSKLKKSVRNIVGHKLAYQLSKISKL